MAASPAEPVVARAFGGRVIAGNAPGPASYDRCGLRHVFVGGEPGWRYALDVERCDTPLDPALAAVLTGLGATPPLQTWTLIEVVAKLTDRPAHLVMRAAQADGLEALIAAGGIVIAQPSAPDHLISVGRAPLSR